MYSVPLNNTVNLKTATIWLGNYERDCYGIIEKGFARYYAYSDDFIERIKINPDIKWGYQVCTTHDRGRERSVIHILFADKEFAFAFGLMGFLRCYILHGWKKQNLK